MQPQEGAQCSRNTANVKKLLQNNEMPSKQEETVTEASQKQEEPTQQQNVLQEPNVAETKVQPEGTSQGLATKMVLTWRVERDVVY